MWVVLLIFAGAAVGLLWPRSRHSLPATAAVVVASVAAATSLWGLVRHTANLPRSGTQISNQRKLLHQCVAVGGSEALMVGDILVRLDLKSGRITESYPEKIGIVLTSASSSGELTLLTYHDGPGKGGWGLLGADGWIVPPHLNGLDGELARGHWDRELGRFALTTPFRDPNTRSIVEEDTSAGELRKVAVHTVRFQYLDTSGGVSDGGVMRIRSPIGIGGLQGVCRKGDRLAAWFLGEDYCFLEPGAEDSTYLCRPPGPGDSYLHPCPEHIPPAFQHRGWWTPTGRELLPPPPVGLVGEAPLASRYCVRFGADGPVPDVSFWTTESGTLVPLSQGFAAVSIVDEETAREAGHVEWETRLDFLDLAGTVRASRFVRAFGPVGFAFAQEGEVVLVDHSATEIARFSEDTFERVDDPGAVTAVLDRLRVWGGTSHFYEGLLVFCLVGILGLVGFIPLELARRRNNERFVTLQRLALLYLFAALPILAETIETIWHL